MSHVPFLKPGASKAPGLVPVPCVDAPLDKMDYIINLLHCLFPFMQSVALPQSTARNDGGCGLVQQRSEADIRCLNPDAVPFVPDPLSSVVASSGAVCINSTERNAGVCSDFGVIATDSCWEPLPFFSKADIPAVVKCSDVVVAGARDGEDQHQNNELFASLLKTLQDDSFQSSSASTLRGSGVCGAAASILNAHSGSSPSLSSSALVGTAGSTPTSSSSAATNDAKVVFLTPTVWRWKTGHTNMSADCMKRMFGQSGFYCPKDNAIYRVAWPRV